MWGHHYPRPTHVTLQSKENYVIHPSLAKCHTVSHVGNSWSKRHPISWRRWQSWWWVLLHYLLRKSLFRVFKFSPVLQHPCPPAHVDIRNKSMSQGDHWVTKSIWTLKKWIRAHYETHLLGSLSHLSDSSITHKLSGHLTRLHVFPPLHVISLILTLPLLATDIVLRFQKFSAVDRLLSSSDVHCVTMLWLSQLQCVN